ncbi:cellulase family glycosylhydrolase [Actinopolymorpha sp. B9G3]|uniref:cellulase family glycosylhydrolase n=1 Tax=Actinopolymorpha sp. B9G3 TaxID=3158970 RepID=UPI0032D93F4C
MHRLLRTLAASAALAVALATTTAHPAAGVEKDAGVVGVAAGDGSLVIAGTDTPFVPLGFNSVGVLYPEMYPQLCDSTGMDAATRTELSATRDAMVNHTARELRAMESYWNANTVRFQVSQGALALEANNSGADPYTSNVLDVVETARELRLIVIVSLQTQGYGCTPHVDGEQVKLPNHDSVVSWQQLATSLGSDEGVILEIFNEPQTKRACDTGVDWSWPEWMYGCDGAPTGDMGMVGLGKQVRAMAPNNVLLFDGDNNGGKFTEFVPPPDIPDNSAYAPHTYFYADGPTGNSLGEGWDARFGHLQESGEALVVTEWNGSASCKAFDLAPVLVKEYLPAHQIGLFVHSWDAPAADLVDKNYHPVDSVAKCPEFTGASLAYDYFWSQTT